METVMKRICVFCGSRPGLRPEYRLAAEALGQLLAERGIELVYGGGRLGLMGHLADACLAAGGSVVGVIPRVLLDSEMGHLGLTRLEIVASMHVRKARMAELADGFIAMPGGLGTFEELFEMLTWAQLGFHAKPIGLLNVAAYFRPLIAMMDAAVAEAFMKGESRGLLLAEETPAQLLRAMAQYHPPTVSLRIRDEKQL
jgi:uncharacterized protein (TIGR00730 family)